MRRRSVIKTVGSITLGSSVLGTASASPRKKGGLQAYERHCKKLNQKYGDLERQNAALLSQGEVKTLGQGPQTQDIAALNGSEHALAAMEELEFADGTIVPQTVTSEDGEVIEVEIDGRRFTMERSHVKRVLKRRKQLAGRRLAQSKPASGSGEHVDTGASTGEVRPNYRFWSNGFSNQNEKGLSSPVTGGTYNNAGVDYCNTSAEAAVAGAASGYAEAWDNVDWTYDGDILANFEGSYNAAAWNVLASSEIKLQFFIEEDGSELGQTYARYKSSFLGDYWHEEDTYNEDIFVRDPPSSFTVRMKGYSVAAAIGTSTTAVSAADPAGGHHHGYFEMDHYTLDDR